MEPAYLVVAHVEQAGEYLVGVLALGGKPLTRLRF